jgi:hypothetical protein
MRLCNSPAPTMRAFAQAGSELYNDWERFITNEPLAPTGARFEHRESG